jgi:hypothetical protein
MPRLRRLISPNTYANRIDEVLNAQTRASIVYDGSVVPGSPLSDILNRTGYVMTENAQPPVSGVLQASKILISGGVSTTAALANSVYVLDGSPATITTNATDYAPSSDVLVNSSGWKPGEEVEISWKRLKRERPRSTPFRLPGPQTVKASWLIC